MAFPINLFEDFLVVRSESEKAEGVLLPDWKRSLCGSVLARGPKVKSVQEGDKVSFGAATGMDSKFSGEDIRILREKDLDFVYDEA